MSAPTPSPPLPEIDGLDTVRGLQFFADRRGLYLRSLRQFVELYAPGLAAVETYLVDPQSTLDDAARREIHAVGGVGASLGATRLEQGARQVEAQLRQGADDATLRQLVAVWRGELAQLLAALRQQLPND